MSRLIEVLDVTVCPSPLTINLTDVLLLRAAGGHVKSGNDVIEMLGPFVSSVLGDNGEIFTPMGPPNMTLFRARKVGRAVIDVITGDVFHAFETTELWITVRS